MEQEWINKEKKRGRENTIRKETSTGQKTLECAAFRRHTGKPATEKDLENFIFCLFYVAFRVSDQGCKIFWTTHHLLLMLFLSTTSILKVIFQELWLELVWNLVDVFIPMNFKIKTSHDEVTMDGLKIGNQIYWSLTDSNYKYCSTVANSRSLKFTTARASSFQSAVSWPVV